jgi:hypothetical protein
MEILVDLVGHTCWDWCVALDKITFGFKLGDYQNFRAFLPDGSFLSYPGA